VQHALEKGAGRRFAGARNHENHAYGFGQRFRGGLVRRDILSALAQYELQRRYLGLLAHIFRGDGQHQAPQPLEALAGKHPPGNVPLLSDRGLRVGGFDLRQGGEGALANLGIRVGDHGPQRFGESRVAGLSHDPCRRGAKQRGFMSREPHHIRQHGGLPQVVEPEQRVAHYPPRRSPRMTHLCSDRVTHQKRRTLIRKPQVGKALSSPPKAGRWVRFREQTRVISREFRRPGCWRRWPRNSTACELPAYPLPTAIRWHWPAPAGPIHRALPSLISHSGCRGRSSLPLWNAGRYWDAASSASAKA